MKQTKTRKYVLSGKYAQKKAPVKKIVQVNGAKDRNFRTFGDLLIVANSEQLSAMSRAVLLEQNKRKAIVAVVEAV